MPSLTPTDAQVASLARVSGLPLASYRRSHVVGCVERAAARAGVGDVAGLIDRLRRDGVALAAFRRGVLVPVTRVFRDQAEFEFLDRVVLPEVLERRALVDVWSAGCANGDELRSVLSLIERQGALDRVQLLGSDLLEDALRLREPLSAEARAVVRFERRDLVRDPPPELRFDLVLCRNVAIYLAADAQVALHRALVAALRPWGYLMLGASETLVRPESVGLEQVTRHVFRKVGG